jgi:cytochrome c2
VITRFVLATLVLFLVGCATPLGPTPTATFIPPTPTPVPPTPTLVPPTATATHAPTVTPSTLGNAANGAKLFSQPKIECDSCHDVTQPFPGGEYAPNLGNIATEAERVIKSPDYTGQAKTVAEYLRESILTPNVYIVPGDNYREKDGKSAMEQRFAEILTPQQVEDLIAYLLTLK